MSPHLLFADEHGRVFDHPVLRALALTPAGAAPAIDPPVALPPHATLSVLPGRRPLGLDPGTGEIVEVRSMRLGSRVIRPVAVGAVLPPGWTRLAVPAYRKLSIAPVLPQWAYTMAGW
ncbi:MAG: radical SAM protein, partial [Myxococcales bacterium]